MMPSANGSAGTGSVPPPGGTGGRAGAVGALLAFALLLALATALFSQPVENFARDLAMSTISPFEEPGDDIVIVSITEETLGDFAYRSPIDRRFLAELVDKLAQAKPKGIGLDILFDQPTEREKDTALLQAIARAVKQHGVPVIIADALAEDGLTPAQIDFLGGFAPQAVRGLANLRRDPYDAVVRGRFAGRQIDGDWRPGFAAALAEAANTQPPRGDAPMVFYRSGDGEPFAFTAYPAHTAGLLPPQWFEGKFVLVGVDLPIEDRHATPFILPNGVVAGTLPGVEIHAHLLAQFLRGDAVRQLQLVAFIAVVTLLSAVAALLCWLPLPTLMKPLVVAATLAAYWAGAAMAFSNWAIAMPVAAPGAVIAGTAFITAFLAWKRDRDRQRYVEAAFGRYVSPAVVRQLIENPDLLRLGGEKRQLTCLFTDLEGFTTLSEQRPPEEMASILNEYLDYVCDLFIEHGATIDKVIGDAVVGFYGAPAPEDEDAAKAVELALAVDRFSEAHRERLRERGIELGVTRVGIHRGPAIVGNFGGERFFDYTAIGDTMNTAARLESANRHIGTRICVSAAVARNVSNVRLRPSGILYLKGKSEGIEAFEPLHGEPDAQQCHEAYCDAFELMRSGDDAALHAFEELCRKQPQDGLAAYHCKRLRAGEQGADIALGEK